MTDEARIVAETEARIVAWLEQQHRERLRRIDGILSSGGRGYDIGRATSYGHAASAIQAGDHRKDTTNDAN